MSFAPGSSFSTYQILSLLGSGGMGEVYRARDSKLGRDVAIKVLPDDMAADRDRRTRFAREAHVLASLNHPNIAAVFGYEEVDGRCAIILELVEGVTLSDRLTHGPLPVDEAVAMAIQITRALEAAHEKGIVHRDLKPANIRIRPDGTVKVLDFGIAKMLEGNTDQAVEQSPTITNEGTLAGVIIGTAAYMSPEQSRGTAIDARTDIWAFGCVLFEMLTGRSAFAGNTMSDTIAAVLTGDPDWSALPSSVPKGTRRVLRRTLVKDPRERLHNIVDARLELQEAAGDATDNAAPPRRRAMLVPIAAAVAAALLTGFVTWMSGRVPTGSALTGAVTRFPINIPNEYVLGSYWMVDISPDGRQIVYAANGRMFLRSLDRLEATPLGDATERIDVPVFSPDGLWIAYSAFPGSAKAELRRINVAGGQPTTLCATTGFIRGMRWIGDRLVFAQGDGTNIGIYEVPAAGGSARQLVASIGDERMSNPDVLDDGDTLLFTRTDRGTATSLLAMSLKSGQRRVILDDARWGRVLPDGHLLYVRANTLAIQPIDLPTLKPTGGATVILDNIPVSGSFPYAVNVAINRTGSLAYMTAPGQQRLPVWLDRTTGRETPVGAPPKPYVYPNISPDGSRIAFNVRENTYADWIWDVRGQTLSRITTDAEDPRYAIWSADSRRVMYSTTEGVGLRKLVARPADGSGSPEALSPRVVNAYPLAASPDGRFLLFKQGPAAQFGLEMLSLGPDRGFTTVLPYSGQSVGVADISPDGRWIVHQEGGAVGGSIVVRPFPHVEGGRWVVAQGGTRPLWSKSGRELFYLTPDASHIAAIPIGAGPAFTFSHGTEIADVRRFLMVPQSGSGDTGRTYDVSADGQRFLVFAPVDNKREEIVVVEHWINELTSPRK